MALHSRSAGNRDAAETYSLGPIAGVGILCGLAIPIPGAAVPLTLPCHSRSVSGLLGTAAAVGGVGMVAALYLQSKLLRAVGMEMYP